MGPVLGSGVIRWMLLIAAAETLFLTLGWFSRNPTRPELPPRPRQD